MGSKDDNVVKFTGNTIGRVPVYNVLNSALEADLGEVLVCGYEKDGTPYFASSMSYQGDILLLLEKCKKETLEFD